MDYALQDVALAYVSLARALAKANLSGDAEVRAIEVAQEITSGDEDTQVVLGWFHSAVAHVGMVR